ncbi:hypothetical protein SAMN05444266_11186 [Chitinophaga jiangningensis]|uniref:HNH endonuclease n=1 Tax=Chitinophaga jiangningensis TaxID=1419482 RepID=A0A1M7LQ70_9BACT|nr:hypothetical protein [Chitinophaga jiangningensis]SHM80408.1 hypothetical protein SAMN05444266_11186 [Chitinophaga jiangningensis]
MRPVKKIQPAYLRTLTETSAEAQTANIHHALIESMGNYCSYCEMPLSDYHVEHIRYLASWPEILQLRQWDDLLLICNDCRSHIRVPELNKESADAMLWPDKDITFSLQNSPFLYELRKVNYVVEADGEVISSTQMELVFVVANKNAGESIYEKAVNTITHFQLNMQLEYYDAATNELRVPLEEDQQRTDNRMFKRTRAWREAEEALLRLKALDNLKDGTSGDKTIMREVLIKQIAMTAWYSGNWSVWMTVFHQLSGDLELMKAVLASSEHPFTGLNNEANAVFGR